MNDGRTLGVLLLDTHFPRPPGDIGSADTFAAPVRFHVVQGACANDVVSSVSSLRASDLPARFVSAASGLQAAGVAAITTSCGFLAALQAQLQAAVAVPVVSSELLWLPQLLKTEQQVGVLTFDAASLGSAHLLCAGVPQERLADVLIEGMPAGSEFVRGIRGDDPQMDLALARGEVVAAAQALKARAPTLRTLVFECTNMPPYAQDVEQATGLRTLSLLQHPAVRWAVDDTLHP